MFGRRYPSANLNGVALCAVDQCRAIASRNEYWILRCGYLAGCRFALGYMGVVVSMARLLLWNEFRCRLYAVIGLPANL